MPGHERSSTIFIDEKSTVPYIDAKFWAEELKRRENGNPYLLLQRYFPTHFLLQQAQTKDVGRNKLKETISKHHAKKELSNFRKVMRELKEKLGISVDQFNQQRNEAENTFLKSVLRSYKNPHMIRSSDGGVSHYWHNPSAKTQNNIRKEREAATHMQAVTRGKKARSKAQSQKTKEALRKTYMKTKNNMNRAATRMQAASRGMRARENAQPQRKLRQKAERLRQNAQKLEEHIEEQKLARYLKRAMRTPLSTARGSGDNNL